MLSTKNYKHMFKFVKVINRNTLSVFHLGYNKNDIFDDVIITSLLHTVTWQYKEKISRQFSQG